MARQTIPITNDSALPKTAYLYGGPPVVGKDAQTEAFEARLGIPVFKSGPALKAIAAKNPGGPEDIAIRSGDLTNDSMAMWAAKQFIYKHTKHREIKLNGIPRRIKQMKIIEFLRERGFAPKVIWFTTPVEVCIARPHRADRPEDTPENRARRMEIYLNETHPVLNEFEFYNISESRGNLLLIDNTDIQKHQVTEKIIDFFGLPYNVSQVFPVEQQVQAICA